ncbi:MAG: hypothetical protein LC768_06650 [Acidobacteria bacterium]|nr:hypothetical protein [Acidobacteriota bacterium]MCA1638003.1 hypothetical protein [Acidobacteriota bacterium]
MLKNLLALLLFCLIAFGCSNSSKTQSNSDILGIRVGMSKDDTTKRLNEIGKLDHEERKQQEIWTLNNDPRYSHLIVAFDKEKQVVRYITAKARENGSRVRYSDVIDIVKAQQRSSSNNYKYIEDVQANESTPGYTRIASGTDSNYLTYFSLKELNLPEEEAK